MEKEKNLKGKKVKEKKVKNRNRKKRLTWNNLKIGYKYGVVLLIVFILFAISASITINSIFQIDKDMKALEATDNRLIMITQMGSLFREKDVAIGEYIFFKQDSYAENYKKTRNEFRALLDDIEPIMNTENLKFLYGNIARNDEDVDKIFIQQIIPSVKVNDESQLINLKITTSTKRSGTVALLEKMREEVKKDSEIVTKAANEHMENAISILIIAAIISIVFGIFIMLIISRRIKNNLENVIQISNKAALGDLTVDKMKYQGEDEIGQLSTSINKMVDDLRAMMQEMVGVSQEVDRQSDTFTNIAKEVKNGSEQISATMQQMAVGAEEQANSSTEIAHAVNKLGKLIQETNMEGEALRDSSKQVAEVADVGNKQIVASVDQMNVINHVVKDSVEKVKLLNNKAQNISQLGEVINQISGQTNLLALNAAIEAARAGEAGRGFSVVADEIRKLAEQVGSSATEIGGIVEDIQNESERMKKNLEDGYKQVESGTKQIKYTQDCFNKIDEEMPKMVEKIEQVSKNLESVLKHSEEISGSVEQVAAIAEENSASIEETSALTQQQNSSMDIMKEENEKMISIVEKLKGLIEKFKL